MGRNTVGDRAKTERVHRANRARPHRENVADDSAHPGGRALKRLDRARVIVRLDFERDREPVADVDDPGIFLPGANARRENQQLAQTAPRWARQIKPVIVLQHRLRRLLGGMYFQKPFTYAIYSHESPERRQSQFVTHPTFRLARK